MEAVRFYTGPDDVLLAEQYYAELRQIQTVVEESPQADWLSRFARLQQRGIGIPPRPGWVVLSREGPRSPRPLDWMGSHPPRWVVEVVWPGESPLSED